ncbi:MAG: DUF1343 domain-containing protein [Sandaracinaceae bacterium]|nr:MAG: DUF1343 domain-containing protein [Sandaracinaceae bacterium]
MRTILTGLQKIADSDPDALFHIRGKVGLLAHPASVDEDLSHARDVLLAAGADLRALFGPEHGFGGEAQDMIGVGDASIDGVPIHSLYGATEETLSPQPEHLEGLDVVVVDLQDVGSRYYTYVWSCALMLKAAAKQGVRTLVLDRPNPLGGVHVEGAPQREGFRSFVGLYDVSVRHGMTVGEIAKMVCALEGIDPALLHVVEMRGWDRGMTFEQTGLPWVLPSPNMPTLDTARVYPGGCVIEGTALSEGRGLTRPFEIWGAPGLDGGALAERAPIDGAALRPTTFQPTFQKHAGQICGGVQVHVTDPEFFQPYAAYLRLIAEAAKLLGDDFAWRPDPYEFIGDVPAVDLLTGGPEYRAAVEGRADLSEVLEAERAGARAFRERRREWLIY